MVPALYLRVNNFSVIKTYVFNKRIGNDFGFSFRTQIIGTLNG